MERLDHIEPASAELKGKTAHTKAAKVILVSLLIGLRWVFGVVQILCIVVGLGSCFLDWETSFSLAVIIFLALCGAQLLVTLGLWLVNHTALEATMLEEDI